MARQGFRLVRFRSPLLTESRFLSLPEGTEMFQFPSLALPALCIQTGVTGHDPSWVSPFGNPWFCGWLTPHQGLSQPPTSFFASRCLGIHRVHFSTCRRDARARYGVLKQRATFSGGSVSVRVRPTVLSRREDVAARRDSAPSELHSVPIRLRGPRRGRDPAAQAQRGFPSRWSHGPVERITSSSRSDVSRTAICRTE